MKVTGPDRLGRVQDSPPVAAPLSVEAMREVFLDRCSDFTSL